MSVATSTAIAIGAGVAAAGSVGGAAISSHAAGSAADKQAKAAMSAQQLQAKEAADALAFQKQEWETQQANEAPFLQRGTGAVNDLSNLIANPSTFTYPGGQFQAPTLEEARATPGYQFQLQTGSDALAKQLAATGNISSGTAGTELQKFGQGLADSTYNQDYQRALQTYMTNYGVWNTDTSNRVNRLFDLSRIGANTAANLGTQGQMAAQNIGNIALTTGAQQGQDIQNAAAAQASGIVGSANAWSGAFGNISNEMNMLPFMMMLQHGNSSSYPTINESGTDWAN